MIDYMPSCYKCARYPLCRVMTGFLNIMEKNGIIKDTGAIFIVIAENCEYFKLVVL